MMTNVYRAGVVVATIPVDEGATCKRTIAGVDEITMDVVQSNGSLAVLIGDYIVFEGNNYYLNRPTKVDKKSIVEYHFSLTFEADIYSLLNKLFQQPVTGRGDFGLDDTLEGFVDVLLSNINGIEGGWTKGVIPVTERKLMSFDGENCRAVLNRLADEFDVEFNVIGKQISFYDLYENVTSLVFEHGQGKGLYELSRDNVDSNNTVTRGWFWGASKNIDYSYRVIGDGLLNGETRLVFTNPATGTNRIDNFGDFNKIVERQVVFEDVWPHFTGVVSSVSGDYQTVICPGIDFDVELQLISGLEGKVYFKSGDLQSKQFGIKAYDHASRSITLVSYTDEFGLTYPNEAYNPKVGDEFTFLDIKMPDSYVVAAEAKLAEKAAEWMDYYSKLRVKYSLDLDPRYLRSNAITLNRGDVVRIIDASLGIDKQIRITSIEKSVENPYKVKCEISNILEERWEKKISKQVQEALNTAKTATDKSSSVAGSVAASLFRQYFEVRGTAGNEYIMAKMPFASVGEVSAYASSGFVIPSLWDALPTASATVKGGIKIGSGLSIDANGIVSVTSQGTIQTLSLVGTTLSISGGNSVTIPATYTDVMARAACALSGTVYNSARLGGMAASFFTRRDVAETIAQSWTFNSLLKASGSFRTNADNTYIGCEDSQAPVRLGIVKKEGARAFFATGSVGGFLWKTSDNPGINDVVNNNYTELMNLTNGGDLKVVGKFISTSITDSKILVSDSAQGIIASSVPSSFLTDLNSMFELVPNSGNPYIRAKYNFASIGEVTAYAAGGAIETIWGSMPLATTTSKGGVIVGSGFNYVGGVLSVAAQSGTIQTLSLNGTTLSISGGNSVTIPATYTDVMARSACASIGTVYDSARLGGMAATEYARKTANETISGAWSFSGNVGFGLSGSSQKVHVRSTTSGGCFLVEAVNGGYANIDIVSDRSTVGMALGGVRYFNSSKQYAIGEFGCVASGGAFTWAAGSGTVLPSPVARLSADGIFWTKQLSIDGDITCGGSVGIGVTSLAARLHISNASLKDGLRVDQDAASYNAAYLYNSNISGNGVIIRAASGTNTILSLRDYNNNVKATILGNGNMSLSGNFTATGEVTAYAASDKRLKTNIKTITNAGVILRQQRAVEFDWNETAMRLNPAKRDAPHSVSFIAQAWEKVLPWATHSIFGKYKSIDLNVMTGYLVAGWNEHDKEIKQLRQRVSELENQLKRA